MSIWLPILSTLVGLAVVAASAVSWRLLLALAVAAPALVAVARFPRAAGTVMFVGGVLLLDFNPLPIYRSFLLSDALLLGACATQLWLERRAVVVFPAFLTGLLALYVLGLLVGLAAAQSLAGFSTWLHFAFLALGLLPAMTTLFVLRPEFRQYLVVAIVATALVQAIILFGQIANGLVWQTGTRISGALGTIGLWAYAGAAVALVAATRGPWAIRIAATMSLCILGLAEMFLRSRMLWVTTAIGVSLIVLLQSQRRLRGILMLTAIGAVLVLAYAMELYPFSIQRRISDTLRPTQATDLIARVLVVHDLAPAFEDSYGLGVGIGQSENVLRDQHSPSVIVMIHNVILHAAVEGGLLAASAIVMLPLAIVVLWLAAIRVSRDLADRFLADWGLATLLAIYIGAQLTPTLFEHSFYVLLAALAAGAVARGTADFRGSRA